MDFTPGQRLRVDYSQAYSYDGDKSGPVYAGLRSTMVGYEEVGRPCHGEMATVAQDQIPGVIEYGGVMVDLEGATDPVPVSTIVLVDAATPAKYDPRHLLKSGDRVRVDFKVDLAIYAGDPILTAGLNFVLNELLENSEWLQNGDVGTVESSRVPQMLTDMAANLGATLVRVDRDGMMRTIPWTLLNPIMEEQ